jgi:hypothetical protein
MSTQEGGGGIRTSNLHFMRCGLQPIELPLGDKLNIIWLLSMVEKLVNGEVTT